MLLLRHLSLIVLASSSLLLANGAGGVDKKADPTPEQIQDIITKFTAKETEFSKALQSYTYRQTIKLSETAPVGGSYEVVQDITFDDRDRRTSHVTYAPVVSLQYIGMTAEDQEDFFNIMPFVFTNETASQYTVTYKKREQVDEISCYVFNVTPKELNKDRRRYFDGDIWVDDQDLQIVKTFGRSTGHLRRGEDQQFPNFETYRQQVDGKYWFPVYTYADDTLNFKSGESYRIKIVVKYDRYKKWQFKSESTIKYGAIEDSNAPKNPPPPMDKPNN